MARFSAAGGGTPAGAEAAAERLVAGGATALLSFGLAGGLDPALPTGHVLVPQSVLDERGVEYPVDPMLAARFGTPRGRMMASARILATVAAKAAARAATGADAVDCESGAVARVAAQRLLPFAVLRAICDPASEALPPAALVPLGPGGTVLLSAVLGCLLAKPSQLMALLRLAGQSRRALGALRVASKEGVLF